MLRNLKFLLLLHIFNLVFILFFAYATKEEDRPEIFIFG